MSSRFRLSPSSLDVKLLLRWETCLRHEKTTCANEKPCRLLLGCLSPWSVVTFAASFTWEPLNTRTLAVAPVMQFLPEPPYMVANVPLSSRMLLHVKNWLSIWNLLPLFKFCNLYRRNWPHTSLSTFSASRRTCQHFISQGILTQEATLCKMHRSVTSCSAIGTNNEIVRKYNSTNWEPVSGLNFFRSLGARRTRSLETFNVFYVDRACFSTKLNSNLTFTDEGLIPKRNHLLLNWPFIPENENFYIPTNRYVSFKS